MVSCCKEKEYEEHLIRDIVCDKCQEGFIKL